MATNGGSIKFDVGFNVNKSSLNEITKALQEVQQAASKDNKMDQGFKQAADAARQLEKIVNGSWNDKLNQLNLNKFNQSVKESFGGVQQLKNQLAQGGAQGQAAFNSLASSVLNTNIQLRESNKLLDSMATSMANTVKWGITASIFNNITGSIQQAYYYAKDLDSELTNIRMVTGAGADEMERFAKNANSISKDLGRSTLDYTKAATEYYRQGLSDEEVAARTEVTLKAQNITGAGSEMIDYITAVLNGFQVAADETESTMDKLAAVADSSASDMSELATAMSKVAATANVMGVDVDQLNAQIATVVATTRLAPESVGTAFKTIYSRLNDIKTGADGAEVSLGRYSSQMASLGFNVLDANGNLRDTGDVIEEIGYSWQNLTKEQQVYLASVMGGQRQITQVTALFDNWDKYVQMLNVSLEANGTLNEKNNIYLESTKAHLEQLGTEAQRTFDILADNSAINGVVDALNGALTIFNDFIDGLGGGINTFVYFGSMVAGIFSKQIAQSIAGAEQSFQRFRANLGSQKAKEQMIGVLKDNALTSSFLGSETVLGNKALTAQVAAAEKLVSVQKFLTAEQQKTAIEAQKQIGIHTQKMQLMKAEALKKQQQLSLDERIIGKTNEQLQKQQEKLSISITNNQRSLNVLNQIDRVISTSLVTPLKNGTESAALLRSETSNLKQLWIGATGSVKDFQSTLNIVTKGLETGNTKTREFQEAWQKINTVSRNYSAQQREDLRVIDEYLKNANIEQSQRYKIEATIVDMFNRQNDALAAQAKHRERIQMFVRGVSSAGQAITAWAGSLPTLMDKTATGAEKANAAFSGVQGTISAVGTMFGPIGMGISTLINGALSLLKSVIPGIDELFMSFEERLAKVNNSISQTAKIENETNKTVGNLEELKNEYIQLTEKAGEYGQTVDALTDQEKDKYFDLLSTFQKYNADIIEGYDDQGNAIGATIENVEQLIRAYQLAQQEAKKASFSKGGSVRTQKKTKTDELQGADIQKQISDLSATTYGASIESAFQDLNNSLYDFAYDGITVLNDPSLFVDQLFDDSFDWLKDSLFNIFDTNVNQTIGEAFEELISAGPITPENYYQYWEKLSAILNHPINLTYQGETSTLTVKEVLQQYGNDASIVKDAIINFNNQLGDDFADYQQAEEKMAELKQQLEKSHVFDMSWVEDVLQYGDNGYSDAYQTLLKNGQDMSLVNSALKDFLSQWNYENIADQQLEGEDKYDTLFRLGMNFLENYGQNINTFQETANKIFESNNIENIKEIQGTIEQQHSQIQDLIISILKTAYDQMPQFENQQAQKDWQLQLQSFLKNTFNLSNIELNYNQNDISIQDFQTKVQQYQKQVKKDIEDKIKSYGIEEIDISLFKIKPEDLNFIQQNLDSLDWGYFLSQLKEDGSNASQLFNQIVNDFKKGAEEIASLDFDTFTNPEETITALEHKKKLTQAQDQYLSVLEQTYPRLAELNDLQGRGSKNYINYLKQIKDTSAEVYKQNIQSRRQQAEQEKASAQALIRSFEQYSELNQEQLQQNAEYVKAVNRREEAQKELNDLKYEEQRLDQVLLNLEKERTKEVQDRQLTQNDRILNNIKNTSHLSDSLTDTNKAPLSTDDLTTALYYERINPILAEIVDKQGILGRYTKEYREELERTYTVQQQYGNEIIAQSQAIIESQKQQIQNEIDSMTIRQKYLTSLLDTWQNGGDISSFGFYWLSPEQVQAFESELDVLTKNIQKNEDEAGALDLQMQQLLQTFLDIGEKASSFDIFKDSGNLLKTLSSNGQLSQEQWDFIDSLTATNSELRELIATRGIYDQAVQKAIVDEIKARQELMLVEEEQHQKELQARRDDLQTALDSGMLPYEQASLVRQAIAELDQQKGKSKSEQIRLQEQINSESEAEVKLRQKAAAEFEKQVAQSEKLVNAISNGKKALGALQEGDASGLKGDVSESIAVLESKYPELYRLAQQLDFDRTSDDYLFAFAKVLEDEQQMVAETIKAQIAAYEDRNTTLYNLLNDLPQQGLTDQQQSLKESYTNQIANNNTKLIELYAQQNELLNDQLRITSELISNFESMADKIHAGERLNPEEMSQFLRVLQAVTEQLDIANEEDQKLIDATETLKNGWLASASEYESALNSVVMKLHQLQEEDIMQRLSEQAVQIDFDMSNWESFVDQVEEFLSIDRELALTISTNAADEFERIKDSMSSLETAVGYINDDYTIAVDKIEAVAAAIPGVLDAVTGVHDGLVQLNADMMTGIIANAQDAVQVDIGAAKARLDTEIQLAQGKAESYRKAAAAARQAGEQIKNGQQVDAETRRAIERGLGIDKEQIANDTGQKITNATQNTVNAEQQMTAQAATSMADFMAQSADSQAQSMAQAATNVTTNFQQIATSSDQNAAIMSQNFANAGAAMAASIASMAQSAIQNFAAIATASAAAASGKSFSVATGSTYNYNNNYMGQQGVAGQVTTTTIESNYTAQPEEINNDYKTENGQIIDPKSLQEAVKNGNAEAFEELYKHFTEQAEMWDNVASGLEDTKGLLDIIDQDFSDQMGKVGQSDSGKSPKGGGSGGGKEDQKEELDDLEDKIDRYHDIDLQIQKIDDDLKALQKAEDGLEGAELIANLDQQLALLNEQNAAYERKLELMYQERSELQAVLEEEGAVFDADGYLTNYQELLDSKQAAIEHQMQVYETLNGEQAKVQAQTIEEMKRLYDEFLQTLQAYEDLAFSSIPAVQSEIQDNQATANKINKKKSGDSKKSKSSGGSRGSSGGSEKDITDELIERFKFKVELELDMAKAERDYNKFRKQVVDKVRDDAIPKLNEYIFKDLSSYYRSGDGTGSVGALTQHVTKTLNELKAIDSKGISSVYGAQRSKAMEDLVSYLNELMSNLEDAQKLIDEIKDSIFDTIDQVNDNLDKQLNLYEHISDLISHDVKVVQLLYGKDAFDSLDKYYKMQQKNDNLQLDLLRQQRDLWYDRMVAEQNRMNSLQPNSNAWKEAQDRLEEYKNNWMDATKELNSLLESAINNIIDKYSNAVEQAFDKLEKRWTDGQGLDFVQEEWELINKEADNYLDKINSIYEIQKLEDTFKNAINDNMNDLKAQQALNKLMDEELKFLKDKDKLTQYDVDRANLLLQIEIKRLALENSRQNKTKLRLRRDSQGNYTYQYTADQDEVSKIQQELNELQNNLFNLTNDSYKNGLDSLYSMISEYENKLKDVYLDTTLSTEEQQKQIALYNEYYGKIITDLTAQNEDLKKYLFADTFNTLAQYYENDLKNYQNLTDKQKALANSTLEYFISQSPKYNQNFKNLTDAQRERAAALFAYLGQAYGIDVTNFGNMTALEKQQANSLFKALNDYYGQNEHNFQNMISTNANQFASLSEIERSILQDQMVPQWDSSLQIMIDKFVKQDGTGFVDIFKTGWDELSAAVKQYERDLELLAETGRQNFEKLKQGQDDNIKATQSLIQNNKDLINVQKDLLNGTDALLQELADVEDAYQKQKQSAIQAAEAANAYITSVENLGSALRALPNEKTIHINYDSSGGGSSVPSEPEFTKEIRPTNKFPQYKSDGDYTKDSVGGTDLMSQEQSDNIRDYYADKKNLANEKSAKSDYQYSVSSGPGSWDDLSLWQQDRENWKKVHGFGTGGYTGSWGNEGKLAFVHEKELVLNAQDTQNILSAVDIVRQMDDLLRNLDSGIGTLAIRGNNSASNVNTLDQNVHITATFPNVSDHSEIEKALDTLVNRASQFAFKK